MNQHILANDFLNYITNIQVGQNHSDWICKGKTDITYGSPNGGWNGMNGFLFVTKDNSHSYVIRSIPKEKAASYIVIESLNIRGQLYNMDLSNPRICKESQGKTYLLESYRMTVGKGKKKEIEVENSFKSFGINTNEITVIEDLNPNWAKTLTDILAWAILREKVKLDLKNNKSIDNRFVEIIENFKKHIIQEKTKIKDFSFQKIHPKYVWINDAENKIGKDGFCHYELITRDLYGSKIFVEIHFDDKYKKNFEKLMYPHLHLNDRVFWNRGHKHKELSLAYRERFDFEDIELFSKLANALNYLETNFGELIRNEYQNIFKVSTAISMTKQPLNQILYGPPGTGKTFNSINKALEIINEEEEKQLDWNDRNAVKSLFDQRVDESRIVFTTFHQSMSYEDFIEGIKPEEPEKEGDTVIYKIKYGILRNQSIEASFEIAQLREDDVTEEVLDFSYRYDKFVADTEEKLIAGETVELKIKKGATVLVDSISQNGNVQIKHVDGNRVYTVSKNRLTKLNSVIKDLDKINNIANEFKAIIGGSNSSAYWSVLNAIQKETLNTPRSTEKRNYTFEEKKEVVMSLSKSDFKNKIGKPFVLIIDEINRGNVSAIFGELITLIEEDKRLGKEEALEVTLPYSKDKFGVPANLYIIGTMNTADRSVEALDAALRRRFCFEEMPPLYHLEGLQNDIYGYQASQILKTINSRIEKLIDKDHAIGHSYLLNKDKESIVDSFYTNIIPLLQEYFFGDYGKLGLVLGKGFVHLKESDKGTDTFADFDDDASNDFDNRNVYEIINYRKVKDHKIGSIEMTFEKAIKVLMKGNVA